MEVVTTISRGDVYVVDFGYREGDTTIMGKRPVVIVQNNMGNTYSPNVIVCALTSTIKQKYLPTHVIVPRGIANLTQNSTILTETITTISKDKLLSYIGNIGSDIMTCVNKALMESLGIDE